MHGDWPFSRWATSAKQLRLVNIKLDPNWIAAEPAESRSANRFSEVGGRRRPGGFMAVCRGWDCWDSTGPSAGAWTTCGNLTFLGENTFFAEGTVAVGKKKKKNKDAGALWLLWKKEQEQQSPGKHLTHIYEQCSFLGSGRIRRIEAGFERKQELGSLWTGKRVAAK